MNDHCKLITAQPEDFERMINALETSLRNAQKEIERQAGVIVHDTKVYGQIIRGNERRIAELEAALRDCTITFHILLTDNSGADMKGLIAETKLSARKALEARDGQE